MKRRRRGGVNGGGEGRRRDGEKREASREHALAPGAGEQRRGDARAKPAPGRQCGMAWHRERRHAKRVHRSLRMNPGYDQREGESDYLRETPHPL